MDRLNKILTVSFFGGLLALVVLIFSQQIEFTSLDLGRHLANGREILSNRALLSTNFYSYTETNQPFINHHWLSGVVYYVIFKLGGFWALSVFNILVWLAIFCLAWCLARRRAGAYWTAILAFPTILLLTQRIDIRPENFSYLFFLISWWLLEASSADGRIKRLYWLTPLFLVWVNTHIYFFIGLAGLFLWAASKWWPLFWRTWAQSHNLKAAVYAGWHNLRPWFKYLAAPFIVSFFNPNTWRGLVYPLNILREYGYEVAENKSVFFLENLFSSPSFWIFKAALIVLALSLVIRFLVRRRVDLFELFLALLFSGFALFASRNLAIFALVFWVVASRNLSELSYLNDYLFKNYSRAIRERSRLIGAGLLLFCIVILGIYLWQDSRGRHAVMKHELGWGLAAGSTSSLDFFRLHSLSGPIFNNYDLGSALIFWLYPQEKVFVDNRPEAYSVDFFQNIYRPMQENAADWEKQRRSYALKTIYFSHTDMTPWARTFLRRLLQDPSWTLVHVDAYTVILVEKSSLDSKGQTLAIEPVNLRSRLRELAAVSDTNNRLNLASLAETAALPDIASEIYRQLLLQDPDDGRVLAALGALYASSGDAAYIRQAVGYFTRAQEAGYKLPSLFNERGLAYFNLRDYQKAAADWRAALKLEKKNATALSYLEQLDELIKQRQIPSLNTD